jgi:hypothetical protein
MPFDGMGLQAVPPSDTGLFPAWSRHGLRLWLRASLNRSSRKEIAAGSLEVPSLADRYLAAGEVLREAKGLIDDPRRWMRGTYWWFRGRRCAVGALRAAAKRLKDPVPAWLAHSFLITVARSRGFTNVEAMNDRSSHAAVLRAFDEAIALVETSAFVRAQEAAA